MEHDPVRQKIRDLLWEPGLSEGDRLLADTARRKPASGEMFVLCDGGELVVKRVECVNLRTGAGAGDEDEVPAHRLQSANPDLRRLHLIRRRGPHRRICAVDRQTGVTERVALQRFWTESSDDRTSGAALQQTLSFPPRLELAAAFC